ncbi:signal peptidase II [Roseovarius dicentrarchi]|uniref:signal peptidase II n=1 Tax=Roseovarius dicentrarchi TaxID=2250573 RepID=UPI000DEBFDA5|nr:signal peptidase II [Roseovarius dicentrarchi]
MKTVFWTTFWVFLVDQASKWLVVHWMDLRNVGTIEVAPPYLVLRMAWNYGINFGLMAGDSPVTRWVLIALALVICVAVLWWTHHEPGGKWQKIAVGMLVGGALGNVIDRILYGAVADFLNMSCCGFNNPFAFNVADIAIFAGALGVVIFTPGKKPA